MNSDTLIGTWKLISCEALRADGSRSPIYGQDPIGRLFYDAQGNMAVQMMRPGRMQFQKGTKFGATDGEKQTAYDGYESFFSTYEADYARGFVRHKVLGSLLPNWTGSIQERFFAFEAHDRLVLSTAPIGSEATDKPIVQLVWERLS